MERLAVFHVDAASLHAALAAHHPAPPAAPAETVSVQRHATAQGLFAEPLARTLATVTKTAAAAPAATQHELAEFCRLVLARKPRVLQLLALPAAESGAEWAELRERARGVPSLYNRVFAAACLKQAYGMRQQLRKARGRKPPALDQFYTLALLAHTLRRWQAEPDGVPDLSYDRACAPFLCQVGDAIAAAGAGSAAPGDQLQQLMATVDDELAAIGELFLGRPIEDHTAASEEAIIQELHRTIPNKTRAEQAVGDPAYAALDDFVAQQHLRDFVPAALAAPGDRSQLAALAERLELPESVPVDRVIFAIQSGSALYNLNTESSDEDYFMLFAQPVRTLAGLGRAATTVDRHAREGDPTQAEFFCHEVGFFASLLFKGNPKLLEPLFVDPEQAIYEAPAYTRLRSIRRQLLTKRVLQQYVGFIHERMHRLDDFPEKQTNLKPSKLLYHATHKLWCLEALIEGRDPPVRVDAVRRNAVMKLRRLDAVVDGAEIRARADEILERTQACRDKIAESDLPDELDLAVVSDWLLACRQQHA